MDWRLHRLQLSFSHSFASAYQQHYHYRGQKCNEGAYDQCFKIETSVVEWSSTHGFKRLLSRPRYLIRESLVHKFVHSPTGSVIIAHQQLDRGKLKIIECSMIAMDRQRACKQNRVGTDFGREAAFWPLGLLINQETYSFAHFIIWPSNTAQSEEFALRMIPIAFAILTIPLASSIPVKVPDRPLMPGPRITWPKFRLGFIPVTLSRKKVLIKPATVWEYLEVLVRTYAIALKTTASETLLNAPGGRSDRTSGLTEPSRGTYWHVVQAKTHERRCYDWLRAILTGTRRHIRCRRGRARRFGSRRLANRRFLVRSVRWGISLRFCRGVCDVRSRYFHWVRGLGGLACHRSRIDRSFLLEQVSSVHAL